MNYHSCTEEEGGRAVAVVRRLNLIEYKKDPGSVGKVSHPPEISITSTSVA